MSIPRNREPVEAIDDLTDEQSLDGWSVKDHMALWADVRAIARGYASRSRGAWPRDYADRYAFSNGEFHA